MMEPTSGERTRRAPQQAKKKDTNTIAPMAGPTSWVPIAEAAKLCNMTTSGLRLAAVKSKRIRRKKTASGWVYAAADCVALTTAKTPARTETSATKPSKNLPAKSSAAAKSKSSTAANDAQSARMLPKQAQTAVQKARWVFEGLDMGAISSAGEALGLLRNIVYEEVA